MAKYLTINLQPETKAKLDKAKIVDREPYDSVIQRLLKSNENMKERLQK